MACLWNSYTRNPTIFNMIWWDDGSSCHLKAQVNIGPSDAGMGMYSFCQLMTASMPTFIGRNITAIKPTHDCFYANLGHIMTAD